jgi:hypothetical protein
LNPDLDLSIDRSRLRFAAEARGKTIGAERAPKEPGICGLDFEVSNPPLSAHFLRFPCLASARAFLFPRLTSTPPLFSSKHFSQAEL